MADEISYEVVSIDGPNLRVKYSLGEHSVILIVMLHSTEDADALLKQHAPRAMLAGLAGVGDAAGLKTLIGKKGTADMDPQEPAPIPTE